VLFVKIYIYIYIYISLGITRQKLCNGIAISTLLLTEKREKRNHSKSTIHSINHAPRKEEKKPKIKEQFVPIYYMV